MASNQLKIMQLLQNLAERLNLKVNMMNMAKGTAIAGISTGVGMLVGGPLGVVAGAAVGGLMGIWINVGSKPLTDLLRELMPEQKEKLCAGVQKLLEDLMWFSVDVLLERVLGDTKLKNKIVDFIQGFLQTACNVMVSVTAA